MHDPLPLPPSASSRSWGALRPAAPPTPPRNGRTTDGPDGVHFRAAWRFPPGVEDFIAAQLHDAPRPILHAFCGSSRLGDVRLDLVHPGADVRADARSLPFSDGSFGTILADPPFRMPGNDLVERQAVVREAGRVLRPGGVFLLHAPWMPAPLWADLENVWVRHQARHRLPGPAVLLTAWRKRPDPPCRHAPDGVMARCGACVAATAPT